MKSMSDDEFMRLAEKCMLKNEIPYMVMGKRTKVLCDVSDIKDTGEDQIYDINDLKILIDASLLLHNKEWFLELTNTYNTMLSVDSVKL